MSAFDYLRSTETILAALKKDEIIEPTPIQRAAAAPILAGEHTVLESGTGTGKTLAYLLPLLQRLSEHPEERAVVVAPSAELAVQVIGVARRYKDAELAAAVVVAGGNRRQEKLQKSTRLIVGSAGRVLELYAERKLKGVTIMVLDEPDPILVGSTPDNLREILSRPTPKVQVIVAGATIGGKAEAFIGDVLGERATRVRVNDDPLRTRIAHHFVRVNPQSREIALGRTLETIGTAQVIVFVSQPQRFRHLYRYLSDAGFRPATVNAERTKQQRRDALDAFASGKAKVLLVSDAAGRGIDIPAVDWVVHYEPATSAPGYVHRAGRTGRAGRQGTSLALVSDPELVTLQKFARELDLECSAWPALSRQGSRRD